MANLVLRRRATPDSNIVAVHQDILDRLQRLGDTWWPGGKSPALVVRDGDLETQVELSCCLPDGARGYIAYPFRSPEYLRDESLYDDRLVLEWNTCLVPVARIIGAGFPAYVEAMIPYRGVLTLDLDLSLDDWDKAIDLGRVSGTDEDGRDTVLRFWPANYFDRELCVRAFSQTPEELCERLRGHVERAEVMHDGLLLIVSSEPGPDREDILRLDAKVKEVLNIRCRL